MAEMREYGVQDTVFFPLIDFGDTDFENTPVTFEAGDVQISKDGAAFANTTNLPTHIGNGIYSLILTATEQTCKKAIITIIDQTPSALWEDQAINIETYGDENAQHTIIYFSGTVSTVIPSAPASAEACRIYDYAFLQDGATPVSSLIATARIVSLPEDSNNILHSGIEIDAIYNSTTGLFYWDIVKGAEVEFLIDVLGIKTIKIIPDSETIRLSDIT